MIRFTLNILITLIVSSSLLILSSIYDSFCLQNLNFAVEEGVRTIVIGPSTTSRSISEEVIGGIKNYSRDGTSLKLLAPIVSKILEDNPQVDTLWINYGRFQFSQMIDNKDSDDYQYIRYNLPFIINNLDEKGLIEWINNKAFLSSILNPPDPFRILCSNTSKLRRYGFVGYEGIDRNNLHNGVKWSVEWCERECFKHGGNKYSKEWFFEHCSATHEGLLEMLDICKANEVVPILFFTPLYQYDRWCSLEGFCEYLKDLDSNILIADYENLEFPDDSYYGDVFHLNYKGAEYFSNYIAEQGLNAIRLQEWLQIHE